MCCGFNDSHRERCAGETIILAPFLICQLMYMNLNKARRKRERQSWLEDISLHAM